MNRTQHCMWECMGAGCAPIQGPQNCPIAKRTHQGFENSIIRFSEIANSLHDLVHVALLMDTHRSTRHYIYTCEYIYIYTWKSAIGLSHTWEYASPADLATLPTYQVSPSCWPYWQPCRPATSMCMRMYICIWINICICKYISVYIVPICTSTCTSQAQGPPKPTVTLDVRIHFYETYIYNIWTSMYKFNVHRFRFR